MSEHLIGKKDKYVTFKSGNEYFGLKIEYVEEIVRFQEIIAVPESPEYVMGVINLRGQIITVVDVSIRFKQKPITYDDRTCIIVIRFEDTVMGLIVERIAEVVELGEEDITETPAMHFGGQSERVSNKYVYAMGKVKDAVKLLLDPERLVNDDNIPAEELQTEGDDKLEAVAETNLVEEVSESTEQPSDLWFEAPEITEDKSESAKKTKE